MTPAGAIATIDSRAMTAVPPAGARPDGARFPLRISLYDKAAE